jgi:hypothetical protein
MTKHPQLRCYASAEEMFQPLNPANAYRNFLQSTCIAAKVPERDITGVMRRYDMLAETGGPEMAFTVTLASVGVTPPTVRQTVQTVKDEIQKSLEKLNSEHPGVDKNPISRIISTVKKHNALLEKMAVTINNEPALTPEELERIKLKVPEVCKKSGTYEYTFTAVASEGEKDPGLSLIVRL